MVTLVGNIILHNKYKGREDIVILSITEIEITFPEIEYRRF